MTVTYRDVKADIMGKIFSGDLAPGSIVPNEVDLAKTFGCARATVNRAMRELAEEGIVERRRKAGTRVRLAPRRQARFEIPIVRHEIEEQGATYGYALVDREIMIAPEWLHARLALPPESKVLHLICVHYSDGAAYQFEDRWINLAVNPSAAETDFSRTGPNEWLIGAVPFSNVEMSFLAIAADATLSEHLGCGLCDALFQTERSTWWEGRAVTFVRLTYRPGHRVTTKY